MITVLIRDQQTRQREGHVLELLAPASNVAIARTLAITHLQGLLTVHTDRAAAGLEAAS